MSRPRTGIVLCQCQKGFSLVELTAVILILAIAAAAVTLRVDGPIRQARWADVVDQIAAYDRLARDSARSHDRPIRLVVDPSASQLRQTDGRTASDLMHPLKLPAGYRITRLVLKDQDLHGASATAGSVSITCSRRGLTPSYAILLEGPGKRAKWLLTAGLTGRLVEVDDERTVKDILSASASPSASLWPDAR